LVRFGLDGPSWPGWINVLAGWLVPYLIGIAWARGAFQNRKVPAMLLAGGVAATAALFLWAGYPASMVGVNGARISNLSPPTLAVVTFGIAQVGLAMLLRDRLARWMRRPIAWAAAATANLSAMTLFLWHQTAFLAVTLGALVIEGLPGLHTAPTTDLWVAERLAWLPAFVVMLALLWLVFHRVKEVGNHRDDPPGAFTQSRVAGPRDDGESTCGQSVQVADDPAAEQVVHLDCMLEPDDVVVGDDEHRGRLDRGDLRRRPALRLRIQVQDFANELRPMPWAGSDGVVRAVVSAVRELLQCVIIVLHGAHLRVQPGAPVCDGHAHQTANPAGMPDRDLEGNTRPQAVPDKISLR
jgi:hypothetical protein